MAQQDLFGNISDTKPVTVPGRKLIKKVEKIQPEIHVSEKPKRGKAKAKVTVEKVDVTPKMGGSIQTWINILKSKLLSGYQYHVECKGWHYFEVSEHEAGERVSKIKLLGHSPVYKRYIPDEMVACQKSLNEHIAMFTKHREYVKRKSLIKL